MPLPDLYGELLYMPVKIVSNGAFVKHIRIITKMPRPRYFPIAIHQKGTAAAFQFAEFPPPEDWAATVNEEAE